MPLRNTQWLRWLENNHDAWSDALKSSRAQRRRGSVRLLGTDAEFPDIPGIQPDPPRAPTAPWLQLMLHQDPGFYCVHVDGISPVVFYAATCRGVVWSLPMQRLSARFVVIDLDVPLEQAFRPLVAVVCEFDVPGGCER